MKIYTRSKCFSLWAGNKPPIFPVRNLDGYGIRIFILHGEMVACKQMHRQDDYLISIVGKQFLDGEKGEIQMTTLGSYIKKGDNRYILYDEYDQDSPVPSSRKVKSILKIEGNKRVTVIRNGEQNSRLILEKGQRHMCHYDTGYGSMMIGVFANRINTDLTDEGGNLEVSYSLDINSGLTSMNEIFINVKSKDANKKENSNDVEFSSADNE